jgi:hypothetical protein
VCVLGTQPLIYPLDPTGRPKYFGGALAISVHDEARAGGWHEWHAEPHAETSSSV